jgi:C_GCAxxG_C_C family probable redox protein
VRTGNRIFFFHPNFSQTYLCFRNNYRIITIVNFKPLSGKGILMSKRPEAAVECFTSGFNCAQAVFSAYAEEAGVGRADALRIACGFGAGMGRRQETCGAVTGAMMAIGGKCGRSRLEDTASTDKTYSLVRKLADQFIAKHGAVSCRELMGCDLQTPEGQRYSKEHNLKTLKCTRYVRDAAEIVEAMLREESAA